jgi:hypothetical protein
MIGADTSCCLSIFTDLAVEEVVGARAFTLSSSLELYRLTFLRPTLAGAKVCRDADARGILDVDCGGVPFAAREGYLRERISVL